jgi:hypothetical protein
MNAPDSLARGPALTYRCHACSRCFVAVDEGVAGQILCVCGAPLAQEPMLRGIYELRSAVAIDGRVTNPGQAPKELDSGYNASHGYGQAHGGPTGPSDAPAPTSGASG